MSAFIPASPRDLTPDWITEAMRASGALVSGRVSSLEIHSLTDGGTGFTGDTVRVELAYAGANDGPSTLVAKFPTTDRQTRGMLESFDAYAREIRFYQRFAHRMPCPTPAYLGADFDEKGTRHMGPRMSRFVDALPEWAQLLATSDVGRFMRVSKRRYALLIEDLGADSTVYDMTAPPSESQIADALEVLAATHAAFWDDASLEGDPMFRTILTTTPRVYQTVGRRRCLPMAERRWSDWLTTEHVALFHDALTRFPADVAAVNRKVTLVHGDPRSDNILYRSDGRVALLDWALVGRGHPGFDVGYLLSSSLRPDQAGARRELEAGYVRALRGFGREIDEADLREVVDATYRALTVQQLMGIAVLHNESYGADAMCDLWVPRLLAGLGRPAVSRVGGVGRGG